MWCIAGRSPLHLAARQGQLQSAIILLKWGAQVDSLSGDRTTPLHEAAACGHASMIKLLLENGADPNVTDRWLYSPLHNAAKFNYVEVAKELLRWGTNINAVNDIGESPLHLAAINGNAVVFSSLVEAGCDPYIRDNSGKSALITALRWAGLTAYMYRRGLNLKQANITSHVLFSLAKRYRERLLRYLSSSVSFGDSLDFSHQAMVTAVTLGDMPTLVGLIKFQSTLDLTQYDGWKHVLVAASASNHITTSFEAIKLLVRHYDARFMVTQSGISFVFQRTKRSDLRRWWLVERHQEQGKLADQPFTSHMPTKYWSGVRQVVVPLYGAWASQHYLGSYLDWTKLVYQSKPYWSKWLPLGWESATKPVAFANELDDPIAAYFEMANQPGYGTLTKAVDIKAKGIPDIRICEDVDIEADEAVDLSTKEALIVVPDVVVDLKADSVLDLNIDGAAKVEVAA